MLRLFGKLRRSVHRRVYKLKRPRLSLLLIFGCISLASFIVWRYIQWQRAAASIPSVDARILAETQALATLAQIVGGIVL